MSITDDLKTWDNSSKSFIPTPNEIVVFLDEIEEVCKRHNLSISHEDGHGSFEIERYNQYNVDWLRKANKSY